MTARHPLDIALTLIALFVLIAMSDSFLFGQWF